MPPRVEPGRRGPRMGHLNRLAAAEPPLRCFVNPDAPELHAPADMPEAICGFCRATGQPAPEGRGAIVRCAWRALP